MKKLIKPLSFLLTAILSVIIINCVALTASAGVLDDIKDLFTTGETGLSFEQYTPTESLELQSEPYDPALTTSTDLRDFIVTVVNFALGFLGLFALIIVIYGGVLYVSAAGEEERAQKGRKAITYAAIGLLIVMGSFAFVNTIISGAGGEREGDRTYVVGENFGSSFNASTIQVKTIARDIYTDFVFYAEVVEEIKGMLNDINKPSLDYNQNVVKLIDISNLLFSIKGKLENLRAKTVKFSTSYIKINEVIRNIDTYIDTLMFSPTPSFLFQLTPEGILEKDASGNLVGCRIFEGPEPNCTLYNEKTYTEWNNIKRRLTSRNETDENSSLSYIYKPFREDFIEQMQDYFAELIDIRQSLAGITAVDKGGVGKLYDEMREFYGYKADDPTVIENPDSFMGSLEDLDYDAIKGDPGIGETAAAIDKAGRSLLLALEKHLEFADEISTLQAVEAHLRANITSGNAPLVVTFDVLDSLDPAGGAIIDKNIDWSNLAGTATFEGENVDIGDAVRCENLTSFGQAIKGEDAELYGPAFRQCTFKYPGTYIASVKIRSNDPSKFVDGMSSLIIRVNPPTTKISMVMRLSQGQETTVMDYYDNGILKTDKDVIDVTINEVKEGLTFDASATERNIDNYVQNYRWEVENIKTVETDNTGIFTLGPADIDQPGNYRFEMEVMNQLGEVDRKIFTLSVGNTVARIQVKPAEDIFINDAVTINGGLSTSAGGTIKSYDWVIIDPDGESVALGNNANLSQFLHKFEKPGRHTIQLTVTSTIDSKPVSKSIELEVKSKPPVALFDYEIEDPVQPSTVHFDADKSYDPDGDDRTIEYQWSIKPDSNNNQNWELVGSSTLTDIDPIIKFKQKDKYEVTLKAFSAGEESDPESKTIDITDILDLKWADDQEVTGFLNEEGKAEMEFKIESENAVAYKIEFGDGEETTGDIDLSATVPHSFDEAGTFVVTATVYDADDADKSIQRRIFIGSGDIPIATISLRINGDEIADLSQPVEVSKKDVITFDASNSKNTDGTSRDLNYSWDFGDTGKSTKKAATHSYDELSPLDPGYLTATLRVTDQDDATKFSEDEVRIKVVNKPPTFSSIQAAPANLEADLITPVDVNLSVYGADDNDGQITQYKWWYYDEDDPEEQLGVQITKSPTARITIGTLGQEGRFVNYKFGLEVTDNDNLKASSEDIIDDANIPQLEVENGPNELPIAKFNVDATSIYTGEKVNFNSASSDSDGDIVGYIWDFEGDGFFNNAPTDQSTVEHVYTERNLNGYAVRLKVIDDKGGEATSDPIKIFVDSLAEPPKAAFKYQVVPGSAGKKIKFINNSTADESAGARIISYVWDFDTTSDLDTADSDGDGVKDNDKDSQASEPDILYLNSGTYTIKLTITDNQGNEDSVTQTIKVPVANPPTAAFTFTFDQDVDNKVIFKNNSTADTANGAEITTYKWDFDTNTDSNGDGDKTNDTDSDKKEPEKIYTEPGLYKVKLTVTDNQGNADEVINDVEIAEEETSSSGDGLGIGQDTDTQTTQLKAVLTTTPAPDSDGFVYLEGDKDFVTIFFNESEGNISQYIIDKNIYFDTSGDSLPNNDQDFKTTLPGNWKTLFEKTWGRIVVKLTVKDIYDNENTTTQEIKFR